MNAPAALAFNQRQFTLAELDALANGMATTLEHRGVRAGDRVALMSSNRPEFVVALRAIWRLGAAAVLLSPAWRETEVGHALAVTKPSHAVGDHPVLAGLMPMLSLELPPGSVPRSVTAPLALQRTAWLWLSAAREKPATVPSSLIATA